MGIAKINPGMDWWDCPYGWCCDRAYGAVREQVMVKQILQTVESQDLEGGDEADKLAERVRELEEQTSMMTDVRMGFQH